MRSHRIASLAEVDPEVRAGLDAYFAPVGAGGLNAIADLGARRAKYAELVNAALLRNPPDERVRSEDRWVPRESEQDGVVRVRIYEPAGRVGALPALVYFHGGGLIMGSIEGADRSAREIAAAVHCVIVSVDYRLAPENPHPAALDDCYRTLTWTSEQAVELGVDERRIGLYGGSAGGCLAAGVSLLARDRGGPPIAFQMLPYPMLDDRNESPSSHAILDFGIWDRAANVEAWRHVLGSEVGSDSVSPYAAPARAGDLAGLPPTYLDVGELDLFRDEDVEFALNLMRAGVATELRVYPGVVHGTEQFAPEAKVARRILADRVSALRRALHPAAGSG